MKSALTAERRAILERVRRVVFTNPFSVERVRLDAEILNRPAPLDRGISWNPQKAEHLAAQQIGILARRELEAIPAEERRRLLTSGPDALFLRDVICCLLFHDYYIRMDELIERTQRLDPAEAHKQIVPFYASFERELGKWFEIQDEKPANEDAPGQSGEGHLVVGREWAARVFATCYQIRRAFRFTYDMIVGVSPSMTRLRRAVWDAIFTRNLEWYWRYLLGGMADFSTLITGPTGSGKEQIAQAICRSQYIPFNPSSRKFETDDRALFIALNLAALSPTLMESELFGHVKGTFTGAVEDRDGLMSSCSPHGAVFLDEIGELAPELQVKLLRVLQTRTFYPIGGRKPRRFEGRIVSATNQNVAKLVHAGKMREDFYYRLTACQIESPSLRQRFDEEPEEIVQLTTFLLRRMLGSAHTELESQMIEAVEKATKQGRPWRGNVRELEQFLRQQLVGGEASTADPLESEGGSWMERAGRSEMTLDDVIANYCRAAYRRHGSWEATAKALDADWRTIKKYGEDKAPAEHKSQMTGREPK